MQSKSFAPVQTGYTWFIGYAPGEFPGGWEKRIKFGKKSRPTVGNGILSFGMTIGVLSPAAKAEFVKIRQVSKKQTVIIEGLASEFEFLKDDKEILAPKDCPMC